LFSIVFGENLSATILIKNNLAILFNNSYMITFRFVINLHFVFGIRPLGYAIFVNLIN